MQKIISTKTILYKISLFLFLGIFAFLLSISVGVVNFFYAPSLYGYDIKLLSNSVEYRSDRCQDKTKENCTSKRNLVITLKMDKDVQFLEKSAIFIPDTEIRSCISKTKIQFLELEPAPYLLGYRGIYFTDKNEYTLFIPTHYIEGYNGPLSDTYNEAIFKENLCIKFINRGYWLPIGNQASEEFVINTKGLF